MTGRRNLTMQFGDENDASHFLLDMQAVWSIHDDGLTTSMAELGEPWGSSPRAVGTACVLEVPNSREAMFAVRELHPAWLRDAPQLLPTDMAICLFYDQPAPAWSNAPRYMAMYRGRFSFGFAFDCRYEEAAVDDWVAEASLYVNRVDLLQQARRTLLTAEERDEAEKLRDTTFDE